MAGNNNNDKRQIVCSNPSCQKKWVQGQPMFKSCSQCGQAKYCSKECQRAHWKQHKRACKKKSQKNEQQNQSQQSIKSPQINQQSQQQQQNVLSPKLNQGKKQQNQSSSPQLKYGKGKQSPQLSHKARSPSPAKSSEKDVKSDLNDQKKLIAEIAALKKERQQYLLDKEDAAFFLEQTKKTVAQQSEKMESFTERLRLTLSKVEKIRESLESVKALC